jgi:chemotaxis protein MotB
MTQSESELGLRDEQIAALEKDNTAKKDLVLRMQGQLLSGGVRLPMELSVLLQDFANANEMVTFDEGSGMVKFKSDLVFSSGSDKVTSSAMIPIKELCKIMNGEDGKKFDVIVVGHTDTVPISKPSTRALHPTNWHLSVHRAIAVSKVMMGSGVSPKRVGVKGFGEYRPFVANNPGNKGTAANRRVEILIVPAGTP